MKLINENDIDDKFIRYNEKVKKLVNELFCEPGVIPKVSRQNNIYYSILLETLEFMNADAGCIAFIDNDLQDFEAIVSHGYGDNFLWWKNVYFGEGIVSDVVKSKKTVFIKDVSKYGNYKKLCDKTKSQITIPIISKANGCSNVYAVLSIEKFFDFEDNSVIISENIVKGILGESLLKVRSDLMTIRMRELYKLVNKISEEEDFEKVIQYILLQSKSFVDSSEVALLVRYGAHLKVMQESVDFKEDPPSNLIIGINEGEGYTCYAAKTRRPFYCANVIDKERYPYYLQVVHLTKSQYTVPLIYRRDLVGILNIGSKIEYGFTQDDRELINIFSSLVANAVYNSRLVNELRMISQTVSSRLQYFNFLSKEILSKNSDEGVEYNFNILKKSINQANQLVMQTLYPMREGIGKKQNMVKVLRNVISQYKAIFESKKIQFYFESNIKHIESFSLAIYMEHATNVLNNVIWGSIESLESVEEKKINIFERIEWDGIYENNRKIEYYVVEVEDNSKILKNTTDDLYFEQYSYYEGQNGDERLGVGLGLWVCDQVLSNYGGYLKVKKGVADTKSIILYIPLFLNF